LAASSEFDQQSMIALASSRTLDVAALVVEGLPTPTTTFFARQFPDHGPLLQSSTGYTIERVA
jgi:hypothetical protein